jgi:hypothetical protein
MSRIRLAPVGPDQQVLIALHAQTSGRRAFRRNQLNSKSNHFFLLITVALADVGEDRSFVQGIGIDRIRGPCRQSGVSSFLQNQKTKNEIYIFCLAPVN